MFWVNHSAALSNSQLQHKVCNWGKTGVQWGISKQHHNSGGVPDNPGKMSPDRDWGQQQGGVCCGVVCKSPSLYLCKHGGPVYKWKLKIESRS